jgi:hypothetical protein
MRGQASRLVCGVVATRANGSVVMTAASGMSGFAVAAMKRAGHAGPMG